MKKFALIFSAFIFSGDFKATCDAAEAYCPGSSTASNFDEDQKAGKAATLTFTNVEGNSVTITTGDGFRAVNNEDGSHKGYREASAAEIATWTDQFVGPALAPAPANNGDGSNTADAAGGATAL